MSKKETIATRIGIIDLGTNTAHLLVAEKKNNALDVLTKKRHYTFLAEKGIEIIYPDAIMRLNNALSDFKSIMDEYSISECHITATEVFRKASNGPDVIKSLRGTYGWDVEIITGEREAVLIFKGIAQIVDVKKGTFVVMDIGGGSVEFIISDNGEIVWKKSFPIGIANVFNKYLSHNSLSNKQLQIIQDDLSASLLSLSDELRYHIKPTLIGAAGSFEVLSKNLTKRDDLNYHEVSRTEFLALMNEVLHLSEKERAKVTWIPKERLKYVTAAIILIKVALQITESDKIIVSPYSLKEGMAAEKLNL